MHQLRQKKYSCEFKKDIQPPPTPPPPPKKRPFLLIRRLVVYYLTYLTSLVKLL